MKSLLLLLILPVVLCVAYRSCKVNSRILGGEYAEEGEFPEVVFLQGFYWSEDLGSRVSEDCGGSLINDLWVLTAAHCLVGQPSMQFLHVRVYPTRNYPKLIQSEDVIAHENYRYGSAPYDIGLIRLPYSMATIYPNFKTISLPLQGQRLTSNEVTLVGWGMISTADDTDSQYLKKLEHVALNQSLCEHARVSEVEALCRYPTYATGDACQGDSGGPVFMDGQVVGVLAASVDVPIGTVSFATRTSAFRNWIDEKMRF